MVKFDFETGMLYGSDSAEEWLESNQHLIYEYMWEKVNHEDHDNFLEAILSNPELSKRIFEDYLRSDLEKLDMVRTDITANHGLIILVVGARGSGKTTFGNLLLEMANDGGKKTYVVGPEDSCPPFAVPIRNPARAISDSVTLIDEAAVRFGSRTSMRAIQRDVLSVVHTLRHSGRNYIVVTQTASDTDIKWLRNADRLVIKRQTYFGQEMERHPLMKFIEIMRPHTTQGTLYWADTFHVFIENTPLPRFWTEERSRIYNVWNEQKAVDEAHKMLDDDYMTEEIQIESQLHSFVKPMHWWTDKLFALKQEIEKPKSGLKPVTIDEL